MANRYGPLLASFVEARDASSTIINNSQLGGIETAEITKALGQMARGRFTLLKSAGWDTLVREGRIVSLYQEDAVYDASGRGFHREMGQFVIQTVRERLPRDGKPRVEVRGLGHEHLLTKVRRWSPVGKETIYESTLTAAARAPWTTTLSAGAPHGNDSAALASDANFQEGDEIRIQMDTGDWYVGAIVNPDPPGVPAGVVQITPRIPGDAKQGNAVEGRRARLSLSSVTGLGVGQRVVIRLDNGTDWTTLLEEVDIGAMEVVVADGLPSAAAVGRQVRAYDYSEPALDDVAQIIAPATGWVVEFDQPGWPGTARGTSHAPVGESLWDLLVATAEQTGEVFRMAPLQLGFIPRRRLRWLRSPDSSGMTLYLRGSSVDVAADTEDIDRGVIHSIERERENDLLTRVYPISGDGRIDLEYCTEEMLLRAAVEGFQVVVSTDLFTPDYVQYGSGVAAYGVLEGTVRYGNVSLPKKASLRELQAAADGMLAQAMTTILESQAREYWRAEVHTHRPLFPGQTVAVVNQAAAPTTTNTYYVLEVTERYTSSGPMAGVIMSSLLLSREMQQRPTAGVRLGRQMRAEQMAARRLTLVESSAATTVVSGGGGTPGPHEHGEFLRVDGTRALVGNMAVNAGVTVDGVDISAHAGDPAAHHAPVTAADGSLSVAAGQLLRVADGFAGEGLSLAGGVAKVNTGAGAGTWVNGSDQVGVWADPVGGLQVAAGGVGVKRPANSGLKLSAGGTEVVPGSVGAKTANANVGETHTHVGLAFADGKAAPGEILKTDVNGDVRTRWLSADKVRTGWIESEAGAVTVDPFDGKFNVGGDVVLTGAGRAIRSAVGQGLLVAPAGRLMMGPGDGVVELQAGVTIKSAHWASGFLGAGWGMTYPGALDCRSVTADEMIVQTFIADAARVRVGQLWVTPGAALLAEAFTVPAVGGVGTMVVEDAPGWANLPVFDAGDWVLLQLTDRSGGGLKAALAWGQVSGYADGPGAGQQTWTFTCRQSIAAGQVMGGGGEVLGFAKSGASWIQANAVDAAGAPWLGMSLWRGDNPYTDGNRVHFLRLGQLRGVTGVWEAGLHVGQAGGRRLRWSELAAEIHGARMSLYAGDGAQARVTAADVRLYQDATNYVTLTPNGDGVATNVVSSGSGYYGQIDDSPDAPNAADWVANGTNTSGQLSVQLSDPSVWGAIYAVTARVVYAGVGFSSDTVRLYAQVVAADEVTPLTSEELVGTLASNATQSVARTMKVDAAATQAQWAGARLRLRWDYSINSAKEAIRLDPQAPSIAVGMGLPTGMNKGGDGFWVGAEGGLYQMRLGRAQGVGLRWDGAQLAIRNSANQDVIRLASDGTSEFARAMTLGPAGGIWQGTGTFDAPGTGLKLWRDGAGIGRLSSFSGGLEQVTINSNGQLTAGQGKVVMDRDGLQFLVSSVFGGNRALRWFADGDNVNDVATVAAYQDGAISRIEIAPNWQSQAGTLGTGIRVRNRAGAPAEGGVELYSMGSVMMSAARDVQIEGGNRVDVGLKGGGGRVFLNGGVVIGNAALAAPSAGRIVLAQSTGAATVPGNAALLYLERQANGRQALWVKFDNGSAFRLAESAV